MEDQTIREKKGRTGYKISQGRKSGFLKKSEWNNKTRKKKSGPFLGGRRAEFMMARNK